MVTNNACAAAGALILKRAARLDAILVEANRLQAPAAQGLCIAFHG